MTDPVSTKPFVQGKWSVAAKLADWHDCPRVQGLYAIGIAWPQGARIGPPVDNQGLLGGLPENFDAVYVGRSVEKRIRHQRTAGEALPWRPRRQSMYRYPTPYFFVVDEDRVAIKRLARRLAE